MELPVSYEVIREAMGDEPYTMSLVDCDEIEAVVLAVNEGIDSHLEACFCPLLGDSYAIEGDRLNCVVSSLSLSTLLRRLYSIRDGERLAGDILYSLGIEVV